ncbi:MAG: hypothetical protein WCX64_06450 [Candidatus Micrarchaeia archaeon]
MAEAEIVIPPEDAAIYNNVISGFNGKFSAEEKARMAATMHRLETRWLALKQNPAISHDFEELKRAITSESRFNSIAGLFDACIEKGLNPYRFGHQHYSADYFKSSDELFDAFMGPATTCAKEGIDPENYAKAFLLPINAELLKDEKDVERFGQLFLRMSRALGNMNFDLDDLDHNVKYDYMRSEANIRKLVGLIETCVENKVSPDYFLGHFDDLGDRMKKPEHFYALFDSLEACAKAGVDPRHLQSDLGTVLNLVERPDDITRMSNKLIAVYKKSREKEIRWDGLRYANLGLSVFSEKNLDSVLGYMGSCLDKGVSPFNNNYYEDDNRQEMLPPIVAVPDALFDAAVRFGHKCIEQGVRPDYVLPGGFLHLYDPESKAIDFDSLSDYLIGVAKRCQEDLVDEDSLFKVLASGNSKFASMGDVRRFGDKLLLCADDFKSEGYSESRLLYDGLSRVAGNVRSEEDLRGYAEKLKDLLKYSRKRSAEKAAPARNFNENAPFIVALSGLGKFIAAPGDLLTYGKSIVDISHAAVDLADSTHEDLDVDPYSILSCVSSSSHLQMSPADLREFGLELTDLMKASGNETFIVPFSEKIKALKTKSELSSLLGLASIVLKAGGSYYHFESTLDEMEKKGFTHDELYGKGGKLGNAGEKIARFYAMSGNASKANSEFFKQVDKGNFGKQLATVYAFFNHSGSNVFQPKVYDYYLSIPEGKRTPRSDPLSSLKRYLRDASNGVANPDSDLPDELREDIDLMLVNSTSVTRKDLQSVRRDYGTRELPRPNFSTQKELEVHYGKVTGKLSPDEREALAKKVAFVREVGQKARHDYLAGFISSRFSSFLLERKASGTLGKLCERLARSKQVEKLLSVPKREVDVASLKAALAEELQKQDYDAGAVFSDIDREFIKDEPVQGQAATNGKNGDEIAAPARLTVASAREALPFLLLRAKETDVHVRNNIEKLSSIKLEDGQQQLRAVNLLSEVFNELKPTANDAVRNAIREAAEVPKFDAWKSRFKSLGGEIKSIRLVPAKTRLDHFYGHMGENCTSYHPEELFSEQFTPIRMVHGNKIVGCIHTLTLDLDGKKSLVVPGIEPKESLLHGVDAKHFLSQTMAALKEIAAENKYDQILFSTNPAAQSNRGDLRSEMEEMIGPHENAVSNKKYPYFPSGSRYSIGELKPVWTRPETPRK